METILVKCFFTAIIVSRYTTAHEDTFVSISTDGMIFKRIRQRCDFLGFKATLIKFSHQFQALLSKTSPTNNVVYIVNCDKPRCRINRLSVCD